MKNISRNFRRALLLVLVCFVQSSVWGREEVSFNFDWYFHLGELDAVPTALPAADATGWERVDVPHDFQISQPWVEPSPEERPDDGDGAANFKSSLSARAFKEMGAGWYVKSYTPDASLKGQRLLLDFEGIMYVGDVYLNGERIGGTDYGYVGFEIDVTRKLSFDRENIIAVRAHTAEPANSRWYTGGGLFRDVTLVATNPVTYFVRHPLYITTKDNRIVEVQAEIATRARINEVPMRTVVRDADGVVVYESTKQVPINRKYRTMELKIDSFAVDNPRLWSCESPHLYTASVCILDDKGAVMDSVAHTFGIRTIEFSPEFGMKLNGEKVLLKGIANHHTLGALGAAAYPRAIEKRILMLKEYGFNHIRTSHNPYSKSFMELCDKHGILVVDELYDKWLTQFCGGRAEWISLWPYDLPEWVKRDRNHPCVVMWSLGNELQTYNSLPFNDWGVTAYRMMKPVLQRYDATRPITVAMHPRGRDLATDSLPAPLVHETDIAAYNYRYMYFPGDGRRFPWMMFYQAEANTSMMGPNFYEMDLDRVLGLAYWGQIDYLGESNGWPAKGWVNGSFDLSLQPKGTAYFLRSMFSDAPVVRIAIIDKAAKEVMWNDVQVGTGVTGESWNRAKGSMVSMNVYTNCDRVDLVLNGRVIASKENTMNPRSRNKIRFDNVVYAPGYLEAVAYRAGKAVARHRIETTGEAKRLQLTPDAIQWQADGTDLMHVRVYAVDGKGRRVWSAQDELIFSVEGDARIVAVDNGNIYSHELHVGNTRRLYDGSALVILRAGHTAGKVVLTVTDDTGKKAKVNLQTL
jgi:beta-galactosidase